VTGLSMSNSDLESKRVEVLKDAVPALRRIMILHDPSMGTAGLDEAQSAARALAVEPLVVATSYPDRFEPAFAGAVANGADGLATMASPFFNFHRKRLIALAARHRLPSIWEGAAYPRDGGLLSYGPSFADMYRRSAGYVEDTRRRQAGRPACGTTRPLRTGSQSADCQGARPRRSSDAARTRRRGDRITVRFCRTAYVRWRQIVLQKSPRRSCGMKICNNRIGQDEFLNQ
jgi:hypothetical protein